MSTQSAVVAPEFMYTGFHSERIKIVIQVETALGLNLQQQEATVIVIHKPTFLGLELALACSSLSLLEMSWLVGGRE